MEDSSDEPVQEPPVLINGNITEQESQAAAPLGAGLKAVQSWQTAVLTLNDSNRSAIQPSDHEPLPHLDSLEGTPSSDDTVIELVKSDLIPSPSRLATSSSRSSTVKVSEVDDAVSTSRSTETSRATSLDWCPSSATLSVEIPESVQLVPRSCYQGFQPPDDLLTLPEWKAVQTLSPALAESTQDFDEILLDDFAIYLDKERCSQEMRSVHQLNTKIGHNDFYFDGILRIGETRTYVRRVPIIAVPIGNYGSISYHTVRDNIWLQSPLSYKRGLYYRPGKPAKEYARFFYPFLWVADLAKHFVDFLSIMAENERSVSIHHFRSTFAAWMKKSHKESPEFLSWISQHPSDDYRTSIAANIGFLHKETLGVLDHQEAYSHAIWAEIWDFQSYKSITSQPKTDIPPTIVTQYIYDCFEHLPFGDRLLVVPLSSRTTELRNRLIRQRHLELPSKLHQTTKDISTAAQERVKNIRPGDTISTHRDGAESGTMWKRELSKGFSDVDRWFALVQSVHVDRDGVRIFDVIWYYRPVDTLCGLMKYPWNNELFLSDHCSCSEKVKIEESEVLGVHDVDFWGTSATGAELFCRQTYLQEERRWVTVDGKHLQCRHTSPIPDDHMPLKYQPGKTYLLRLNLKGPFSEPCEFMHTTGEAGRRLYHFRRLLRRRQVDPNARDARPNELVYSEQTCKVSRDRIMGPCSVRCFQDGEKIPTPYDRDGTGNLFYITHRQVMVDGPSAYVPLEEAPPSLHQGFDPLQKLQKLRGMDLFCGGGNFGRGLEDGGGIEMKWANDYDSKAIHTYMANVRNPEDVHPFLGSIDDLQRLAIQGSFADNVPLIGDVDFVSGGSPCPGFSRLTNDKTTAAQRKNQSLVAAFASFVDLYRPKYGVLENVPGMVHKKDDRDRDVFSQLICSLVGLGYQTQFFYMDASSCGSPQRRSRIFIVFAAPGLELPDKPVQTHSHPLNTREHGIGWLPNGQHMASREMPAATPFKFVSAEEATADLPPIYDAKPDICVPFPDHRSTYGMSDLLRARISVIPTRPWGMNFSQAWFGDRKVGGSGTMTAAEREFFIGTKGSGGEGKQPMSVQPYSGSYGRMFPNRLFETVVTRQTLGDAKNGRLLHWRENRPVTIMEARRAQGFLDEDVLLGDPPAQYRIVGNSVARQPAVALGVTFREAWVASLRRNRELQRVNSCAGREEGGFTGDVSVTCEPVKMQDGMDTLEGQLKAFTPATDSTLQQSMDITTGSKRPRSANLVIELLESSKRQRPNPF
ncbi:S-adenosyl-L-methionine-dependent methyltransferase [Trichoderma longibrachiatum ATCC 18648]|uniref:DNA (cytosine-5-)-methyltransferase n=1 Tax=Trichoderma longibrachiatum ATCC 18648 TaxID=983965 RepID=A0A2T4C750_TRILO|nr:S-adenosyl-L-methionine-dependent methyltransferase [Trichoderma longibrachiatum ATCC 18648]